MPKVSNGRTIRTTAARYNDRRTHFQLICWENFGGGGAPPSPPVGGSPRVGGGGGGGATGGGVPSSAALTASIGSRRIGAVSSRTDRMMAVSRSSGGACRRDAGAPGPVGPWGGAGILVVGLSMLWRGPSDTASAPDPGGTSEADWS